MKAEIENKENELHAEKREYTARQMASEKLRIEGETTQQQLSSSNVFLRHENEKLKNELEQLKQNQVQNAAQGPDSQDYK